MVYMCCLSFLVILFMAVVFAKGVFDSGKTRLIRVIHPSFHPFSSTRPTVCLPLFCWEVNNRPAVVHCSCGPHVDCSRNSLLEHWLGQVRETERGRDWEVQTVPFNTDTRARAEKRGRQADRIIKIPQLQSAQPVVQFDGSGGSTPHYTVAKRNIPVHSDD